MAVGRVAKARAELKKQLRKQRKEQRLTGLPATERDAREREALYKIYCKLNNARWRRVALATFPFLANDKAVVPRPLVSKNAEETRAAKMAVMSGLTSKGHVCCPGCRRVRRSCDAWLFKALWNRAAQFMCEECLNKLGGRVSDDDEIYDAEVATFVHVMSVEYRKEVTEKEAYEHVRNAIDMEDWLTGAIKNYFLCK